MESRIKVRSQWIPGFSLPILQSNPGIRSDWYPSARFMNAISDLELGSVLDFLNFGTLSVGSELISY